MPSKKLPPGSSKKSKPPKNARARAALQGTVLQRLIKCIGNPGIIVTSNTSWRGDLGFDDNSLDSFARGRVSDEFGKPFDGADAGDIVGDFVKVIDRALGA